MKILSVDTASDICGVSILENNNLIYQLDENTGRTHSENLMPMISTAFKKSNLHISDIDLIVCDEGPGSFTGIRIGIATCKAFCDSLNIKGVGVTSLESLAYNIKNDGIICSLIDCKNENCYYSVYELKNGLYTKILEPNTDSLTNILCILQQYSSITFVGDGSVIYKKIIESSLKNYNFSSTKNNQLNSYNLALAGLNKFNAGDLEDILPMYLKKPQAQKQLEERLQKQNECTNI